MAYVLCDLDGTLCDISHRRPYLTGGGKPDWKSFFDGIPDDGPRLDVMDTLNDLRDTHQVILVSGRPSTYRPQTEAWLAKYAVAYEALLMRAAGDRRPDDVIKPELVEAYLGPEWASQVAVVIDDRPSVIRAWRGHGLHVIDVGDGVEF